MCWHITENGEIKWAAHLGTHPNANGKLMYDKGGISNHWSKDREELMVLWQLDSHLEKVKIRFILHTVHRINSKWKRHKHDLKVSNTNIRRKHFDLCIK